MPSIKKLLQAAAGNAGGESLYVEDVFSTFLFTAKSGTTKNGDMVNNINLADEGGMVWIKDRTEAYPHSLIDTERGNTKRLESDSTAAQSDTGTYGLLAFNTDGFELGTGGGAMWGRDSGNNKVATWTFRKAEKFFDVVTYTGDNNTNRAVPHSLGSVPAVIIIKSTSSATASTENWSVYHSSVWDTSDYNSLRLNSTAAANGWNAFYGVSEPTSDNFYVRSNGANTTGETYVAYLFASDAGGFGDDGDENIIKCGSFTTDASGSVSVNLGFEPQWLLVKNSQTTENWVLLDNMRGWSFSSQQRLFPNLSNAEQSLTGNYGTPTANGFDFVNGLGNSNDYIYIAIRRPMKTPESGTEVFSPVAYSGNSTAGRSITSGFPLDAVFTKGRNAAIEPILYSRLQGSARKLLTYSTAAEASSSTNVITSFDQDGMTVGTDIDINNSSYTYIDYFFKRAPGFFDVVAYTGTGSARTIEHNLGVAPELMLVKCRNAVAFWPVYLAPLGVTKYMSLAQVNGAATDTGGAYWNNTTPTSSVFSLGTGGPASNSSGNTYVSYLFATLAGVSKVGSYTGTGADLNVDCGFSAGARFILIKRTDSTGDWYVWDSARGIVAGNDPYLLLNSTAAEVTSTDYIDPLSSGFTVTSSAPAALNASGGNYIFLAIA
jgi:hypothetical protein